MVRPFADEVIAVVAPHLSVDEVEHLPHADLRAVRAEHAAAAAFGAHVLSVRATKADGAVRIAHDRDLFPFVRRGTIGDERILSIEPAEPAALFGADVESRDNRRHVVPPRSATVTRVSRVATLAAEYARADAEFASERTIEIRRVAKTVAERDVENAVRLEDETRCRAADTRAHHVLMR